MGKQIFVGLTTEGTTDIRFLEHVVRRTFEDVAFDCPQDVEVYLYVIPSLKIGKSFPQYVKDTSRLAWEMYGVMSLAVHTDADRDSYEQRMANKIVPARKELEGLDEEEYCKLLTPVIPVRMMEAWMLADKKLFKEEIGTDLSDAALGIERNPEVLPDPKSVIEEAIRIATDGLPKRRSRPTIAELYEVIGNAISTDALMSLSSYQKFKEEVRETFRCLGYMH